MIIGFSGTRKGLSKEQQFTLAKIFKSFTSENVFVHGGCRGADEDAHHLAYQFRRLIYPGVDENGQSPHRGDCPMDNTKDIGVSDSKPYLKRNEEIVWQAEMMIICPGGKKEKLRSGTWSTYRYAKKQGRLVILIYPDGEYKCEI